MTRPFSDGISNNHFPVVVVRREPHIFLTLPYCASISANHLSPHFCIFDNLALHHSSHAALGHCCCPKLPFTIFFLPQLTRHTSLKHLLAMWWTYAFSSCFGWVHFVSSGTKMAKGIPDGGMQGGRVQVKVQDGTLAKMPEMGEMGRGGG